MSEVSAFVDEPDAQELGASVSKTVAETESGAMADGFAISRGGIERAPSDLRRNRDLFGVETVDESVDGVLRLPQQLGRGLGLPLRRLLAREGDRRLELHQWRHEEPPFDFGQPHFDLVTARLASENGDDGRSVDEHQASPHISSV